LLTHGDGVTKNTVARGFDIIALSGQFVAGFNYLYFFILINLKELPMLKDEFMVFNSILVK
jgi:hypothetical protein